MVEKNISSSATLLNFRNFIFFNYLWKFRKKNPSLKCLSVAVVIDPIQSVKGKVVIDAFRTINPQMIMLGQEPRQTTSNLGHLQKPSIQGQLKYKIIFWLSFNSRIPPLNPLWANTKKVSPMYWLNFGRCLQKTQGS